MLGILTDCVNKAKALIPNVKTLTMLTLKFCSLTVPWFGSFSGDKVNTIDIALREKKLEIEDKTLFYMSYFYIVKCIVCSVQFTMYSVRCKVYTARCLLNEALYTMYNVQYRLYNVHCTVYIYNVHVQCTL